MYVRQDGENSKDASEAGENGKCGILTLRYESRHFWQLLMLEGLMEPKMALAGRSILSIFFGNLFWSSLSRASNSLHRFWLVHCDSDAKVVDCEFRVENCTT